MEQKYNAFDKLIKLFYDEDQIKNWNESETNEIKKNNDTFNRLALLLDAVFKVCAL